MSDSIEPALSSQDLDRISFKDDEHTLALPTPTGAGWKSDYRLRVRQGFEPQLIAFANHVLPDNDRRKITREKVNQLRDLIERVDFVQDEGPEGEGWQSTELSSAIGAARSLADALESYLPQSGQ